MWQGHWNTRRGFCALVMGFAVTANACTQDPKVRKPPDQAADSGIDGAVFDIAPDLALMGSAVLAGKESACRMAALLKDRSPDNSATQKPQDPIDQIVAEVLSGREDRVMCAALTVADAEREAVFMAINQSKGIPAGLFLLSYFDLASHAADDSEPHYVEAEVGPIRTLEKCREIEELLREGGIGFRSCRAWEPPNVRPSDK